MLSAIESGPLMSPWVGIWELAWQSPESAIMLLGALGGVVMAGLALTIFGSHHHRAPAHTMPAIVRTTRPKHRARRRRR